MRPPLYLILLALLLLLWGIMNLFKLSFEGSHVVLGLLAIVTGVAIFWRPTPK